MDKFEMRASREFHVVKGDNLHTILGIIRC